MELKYNEVYSSVNPKLIDFQKTTVYLRKDITETNDENGISYSYKEAELTYDEFLKYAAQLYISNFENKEDIM